MALSPVETELLVRVKRAVITLRCLPVDARLKPMGLRSVWPEMKREMAVIYGDTRRAAGPGPTPEVIDDLDRLLDGLAALPAAPRRRKKALDICYKIGYFLLYAGGTIDERD